MYLTQKVYFKLTMKDILVKGYGINGPFVGQRQDVQFVENMQEFLTFLGKLKQVAENGVNKSTYLINIERKVTIADQDDRVRFPSITFPGQEMSVILSTTGKLLYVNDVEKLFSDMFPRFHIQGEKFIDPRPIYLESFNGYDVKYRPLTQNGVTNDVVIDVKGNQLWPRNTGKPLSPLIQLLNKTTEKVH